MESKHLDAPKDSSYARVLFIEFSSAFRRLKPDSLLLKMHQLGLLFPDRQQLFRRSCGVPQGCVTSPLLFTISTNLIKLSDDTALEALLVEKEKPELYYENVYNKTKSCLDFPNRLQLQSVYTITI